MSKFLLEIITPEKQFFKGEVESINIPSLGGACTIMAGHQPMVFATEPGMITIVEEGRTREAFMSEGFIEVRPDETIAFSEAVEALPRCVEEVLAKAGVGPEGVDRFVFHQANQRIIDFAVKKLGIDPARCPGNIERTGNTSAASVPLLLDELVGGGAITSGQKALCVGFGGGLTWAGALLELA